MSLDLLGFERYERHTRWRCSGRVDGDLDDVDLSTFAMQRFGNRWLLTRECGELVAVGDGKRDLVAADGGLSRQPAGQAFIPYTCAGLLRQVSPFTREFFSSLEVASVRHSEHAGRAAVDVQLLAVPPPVQGGELWLGVDEQTGVWLYLGAEALTMTVEELVIDPSPAEAALFGLLDAVPDLDLSHREPVASPLTETARAVSQASGLAVEVLSQDVQTGEFRFLLLDADGQPQGVVSRRRLQWVQSAAIFGGVQDWESGPDWELHVDATSSDPRWANGVLRWIPHLPALGAGSG